MMAREDVKSETQKKKKLAEFKTVLEKKIADVESELESLKILLDFVNKTLLQAGFRRVKVVESESVEKTSMRGLAEPKATFPVQAASGELLANVHIGQNSIRVVLSEEKNFRTTTPPFQQFLIERVLDKMQEKDAEAVNRGEMAPDETFSYELILEGDVLRAIVINNVTSTRIRELKSSIHWTLEKMHDKMKE